MLILTTFDLDEYVYAALRAGASGFLLKDALADDLLAAVRAVASGEAVTAPSVTRRLIAHYVGAAPAPTDPSGRLAALTAREREVLTLIGRGRSNREIQEDLHLAPGTLRTHINRIFTKTRPARPGTGGDPRVRVRPGAEVTADSHSRTPMAARANRLAHQARRV